MTMSSSSSSLPTLYELALEVGEGRLSLTQALAQIELAQESELADRLHESLPVFQTQVAEHPADRLFRRALLELGTAAALRLNSALGLLNFGMNLGRLLCTERSDIERGLALMEQALPQTLAISLEPVEIAAVILEVAETYLTFHDRMGPEYLNAAEQCYQTVRKMPGFEEFGSDLIARTELGLGLCLAEVKQDGQMLHAGEAIEHYRSALQHLNAEEDPQLYGLVLHNMGVAHRKNTRGERAANLNAAASFLRSALEIREDKDSPESIRFTSLNLAEVEGELGHPFRAIALFEHALETLDPIRERKEYSRLHLRLAAYSFRAPQLTWMSGDYFKKLAGACYVVARETADPVRETDRWAAASAGLAMVWKDMDKLDAAIDLQAEVLSKVDPARLNYRSAVVAADHIQFLGMRIFRYLHEDQPEAAAADRERAQQAAQLVQNGEIEPHRKLLIAANLAQLDEKFASDDAERQAHRLRQYELLKEILDTHAISVARDEMDVVLHMFIAVSLELGRTSELMPFARDRLAQEQDFLSTAPSLVDYYNFCNELRPFWDIVVEDDLNRNLLEEALLDAERSRARSLDLISWATNRRLASHAGSSTPYLPDAYRLRHAEYVREWAAHSDEDNVSHGERRQALGPWLRESFLQAANWRGQWMFDAIPHEDIELGLGQIALKDVPTALVEFWCSNDRACAFLRMPDGKLNCIELPGLSSREQLQWIQQWYSLYGAFEDRGPVAIPAWAQYMTQLCAELGEACWEPMRAALETQVIERLIIVPDLWLGSLPMHAMTIPKYAGEYFCDRYEIGYAPSLRQLERAVAKGGMVPGEALFVGNPQAKCPTGDCGEHCRLELPLAASELAALRLCWENVTAMMGNECTPDAVLQSLAELHPGLLHVSSHGITRFEDPLGLGLVLAYNGVPSDDPLTQYINERLKLTWGSNVHGEILSLDMILRSADLRDCKLAMLNACEVGLDYIGTPRESLNLASGFLAAGVSTVISPLWPIAAVATSLLTKRFYSELKKNPQNKLHALMQAQRWLRTLDYDRAAQLVTERELRAGISLSGRERPFSHIFFWAPYRLVGSPV